VCEGKAPGPCSTRVLAAFAEPDQLRRQCGNKALAPSWVCRMAAAIRRSSMIPEEIGAANITQYQILGTIASPP
jgi:hypothetical protein